MRVQRRRRQPVTGAGAASGEGAKGVRLIWTFSSAWRPAPRNRTDGRPGWSLRPKVLGRWCGRTYGLSARPASRHASKGWSWIRCRPTPAHRLLVRVAMGGQGSHAAAAAGMTTRTTQKDRQNRRLMCDTTIHLARRRGAGRSPPARARRNTLLTGGVGSTRVLIPGASDHPLPTPAPCRPSP